MTAQLNKTTEYRMPWPVPYTPSDEGEDLRQRDQAAEWARQGLRQNGHTGINVVSIKRGSKNLIVRVMVDAR